MALAKVYGNNIPIEQVLDAAKKSGWNANQGMAGPNSEVDLLHQLNLPNAQSQAFDSDAAAKLVQAGTPVIIDTPGHYFTADGYDPQKGFHVGTSGTDLKRGGEWMTTAQMTLASSVTHSSSAVRLKRGNVMRTV